MGEVFEIDYPFWLFTEKVEGWGGKVEKIEDWRVGCTPASEQCPHTFGAGEVWFSCNGFGKRILEHIKTVEMPGRMKDRVIFTKRYVYPDGKVGYKSVQCETVARFEKLKRGFVTDLTVYCNDVEVCWSDLSEFKEAQND